MSKTLLQIGSLATDTPSLVKSFFASMLVNKYQTVYDYGTHNYQVTAGKTLVITKIVLRDQNTGAALILSYGDSAVNASDSAPTSEVILSSSFLVAAAALTLYEFNVSFRIPAGKYLCLNKVVGTGFAYVELWGFEE